MRFGGYVDKFMGDAVLAVFGVPVYHNNHSERCLRAALDMRRDRITSYNVCYTKLLRVAARNRA